jgi:O-antigen ligase
VPPPREESLLERMNTPYLSATLLVPQRPWLGHGGGSYRLAFQPVKPQSVYAGLWDHAHNDYVQVAVDTGIVGVLLWMGIGLATAVQGWRLMGDRQSRLNRGVGVGAVMALSTIGLHSMVDFNLHIPANAMTFAVLLALAWVVGTLSPQPSAAHQRSGRKAQTATEFSWEKEE